MSDAMAARLLKKPLYRAGAAVAEPAEIQRHVRVVIAHAILDDVRNVVVAFRQQAPIYVRDVAKVTEAPALRCRT